MNIKTFKLISGEEVVAEIVSDNSDSVVFSNPITVMNGPSGPVLGHWFVTASRKENFTVNRNTVICGPVSAIQEVVNEYNKIYGAGIQVPPEKNIILG